MHDTLGDRMKALEEESGAYDIVPTTSAIYVRVDGRSFHTWVKSAGMRFASSRMLDAMAAGAQQVMDDLDADFGYVQSDEASFGWLPKVNPLSQFPFGGRAAKMNSVVPSLFGSGFLYNIFMTGEVPHKLPSFDARVVEIQDPVDFQKMFYWRYLDAKRNAINGYAQQVYSHKSLQGVPLSTVISRLTDDDHFDYFLTLPYEFREGRFLWASKYGAVAGQSDATRTKFVSLFDPEQRRKWISQTSGEQL